MTSSVFSHHIGSSGHWTQGDYGVIGPKGHSPHSVGQDDWTLG